MKDEYVDEWDELEQSRHRLERGILSGLICVLLLEAAAVVAVMLVRHWL